MHGEGVTSLSVLTVPELLQKSGVFLSSFASCMEGGAQIINADDQAQLPLR